MTTLHAPRPVGNVEAQDGSLEWHGECRTCGQPLVEAVYTGGWAHAVTIPHAFQAFVCADGTRHASLCVACPNGPADPIHQRPAPASTEGPTAMTTKPELPQALHVALLNCQVAQDARSRAHTAYLDSLVNHASKAAQSRLHQEHAQVAQQAEAAFQALGRALDAEGGHALWRIVYVKGGRKRSRVQVRPTRPSMRRNEALARLELRRELEAQGATVQYLVALPVGLADQADGWDRTQGMTRLGIRTYQGKASLGQWGVIAYGQPAPKPDADLGTTPCLAKYADGWDFACTLPQGHEGQHQDAVTDAPATVAWYDTNHQVDPVRGCPPPADVALEPGHTYWCHRHVTIGLGDDDPHDAPRGARTAQDGRSYPDLTGWAPGEITEAFGR